MGIGVLGVGTAAAAAQGANGWDAKLGDPLHIWVGNLDAAKARAWADAHLAAAQAQVDALLALKGERTTENTLRRYDEAQRELDLAGSGAALLTLSLIHISDLIFRRGQGKVTLGAGADDALDVILTGVVAEHDEFEQRMGLAKRGDEFEQVRRASGIDQDEA